MNKIYLTAKNNTRVFLFPITPSEIKIQTTRKAEKYRTITNGDLLLVGQNDLKQVSFESFFPWRYLAVHREYINDTGVYGMECVEIINSMRDTREPLRLVIVGSIEFNKEVIIDKFDYIAAQGKDIRFSIAFTEYRSVKNA